MKKVLCIIALILFTSVSVVVRSQTPVTLDVDVRGVGGTQLKNGYVKIIGKDFKAELVNNGGRFRIPLPETGVYEFWAGGVHHKSITFPLLIEEHGDVSVNIQLATAPFEKKIDSVFLIGSFNDFSREKNKIVMHRLKDGKFRGTVPVAADTVAYQLLGVQYGWNFPLEGTDAHHYTYESSKRENAFASTKFYSVIRIRKKTADIIFDFGHLPEMKLLPDVEFNKPDSRMSRIAGISLDAWRRYELFYHSHLDNIKAGGDSNVKHYDKSKDHADYVKLIEAEQDPFIKQYLLLTYFNFLENDAKREMAELFLREVSPSSGVWQLESDAYAFSWVSKALDYSPEAAEYLHQLISSQRHPALVSSLLYFGVERAFLTGNRVLMDLYYNRLVNEFADSRAASKAMKKYGPENKFSKGKAIPSFSVSALGDKTVTYSPENMKGKVYLLDFWATWCPPCVEQLPDLNNIYNAFKDKGFTILSISADENAEKIEAFRRKRWQMPWLHAILTDGLRDPFAVSFEVTSIPTGILVDEHGVIVANQADIAREGLQEILDRHFSSHKE